MEQCEYLQVTWRGHNRLYVDAQNVVVSVSDGRLTQERMPSTAVPVLMNELGSEGWEMVSTYGAMVLGPAMDIHSVWMKRRSGTR